MKYIGINKDQIVVSVSLVCFGITIQILLSVFSSKLSELDVTLARWAKSHSATSSFPFDTGLIYFLNHLPYVACIISGCLLLIPVLFNSLVLKFKFKQLKSLYMYYFWSLLAYICLVYSILLIIKFSVNRPRPFQTLEFHPDFDTDLNCKLEYMSIYRPYKGPNPCSYRLSSCPSGHSLTISAFYLSVTYLSFYNYKFCKQNSKKRIVHWFHLIFCTFMVTITGVFIGAVMIGRISVLKHFFTDVVAGTSLAVLILFVFVLFEHKTEDNWSRLVVEEQIYTSQ
ncbi:PAP2_superfamily protein [Hexamita inflata]|uniref:PAP2 superfamily protein n=1 Tax=Hexamita inflata TaxID=28002 RepID=A0AA86PZ12_9EUKA|nr:PAP2 superfamily protein [Hexamita inflata]